MVSTTIILLSASSPLSPCAQPATPSSPSLSIFTALSELGNPRQGTPPPAPHFRSFEMLSNRSIARREVFVPTPFTIWEDEPRSLQTPRPHSRHILSLLFIPPLIRPPTPVSACSSLTSFAGSGVDGVDPVTMDALTGGNKGEMETEVPKERKKRRIAKLVDRVKGAFHKLLKGLRHE